MTIAKALKTKKRMVERISALTSAIQTGNSIQKDQTPESDIKAMIAERKELVKKLIDLKSAINTANQPVQEKIFRQGEIKSEIAMYRSLDTTNGLEALDRYYRQSGTTPLEFVATITKSEADATVLKLQEELDKIQEELDHFNFTTQIALAS